MARKSNKRASSGGKSSGGKKSSGAKQQRPRQSQSGQPGRQKEMPSEPRTISEDYRGSGKLDDKVALITGGDSGIGRSIAVMYAREGADVAIAYLDETKDAEETQQLVEHEGRRCLLIKGDLGRAANCQRAVDKTIKQFDRLDVLVNNAAEQHPQDDLTDIDEKQLVATFRTNVFAIFLLTKAALPHLRRQERSCIINTTSVNAYTGHGMLMDYSATKGAVVSFTRSLSQSLVGDGIRVNAVAPGPIWTPLIPSTFSEEDVKGFGTDVPMGRPGQPDECATCFVFLASDDSSYITGQVLHPNGGTIING